MATTTGGIEKTSGMKWVNLVFVGVDFSHVFGYLDNLTTRVGIENH